MKSIGFRCAVAAVVFAAPAIAGETVKYGAAPDWVDPVDFDAALATGEKLVVLDEQVRLERGKVTTYSDIAYRVDSPEMLTKLGTLTLNWAPDKGDLTVHRLGIVRDGSLIDLVAAGSRYEVMRREKRLESRSVDGSLTASLAVPGLKLGDVVRLSQSITVSDQALGENVQFQDTLLAKPATLGFGRVRVSWDKDLPVRFAAGTDVALAQPVEKGGVKVLEVSLPIAKRAEMPGDVPARFTYGPLVQATTFSGWSAISQAMAPHFATEGTIAPGSGIATHVARIEALSADPLRRAAAALRTVQDDVSYLLNGLNGGNYLPQSPADTWSNRYGDCKAKSLLLLAMLREMDIDAEAVLVRSKGGDAMSAMLPLPGAFDHMIVRAVIDGKDYWLDGTSSGTRLDTIDEVPAFYWALPIRAEGADLMPMTQRWPQSLDRTVDVTYDYRSGLDMPILYEARATARGVMGARIREGTLEKDRDKRIAYASEYFKDLIGDGIVYDASLEYDEDSGLGTITAKGLLSSQFEWERGRGTYALATPSTGLEFKPDRARAAWKDLPYAVGGPFGVSERNTVLLPSDATTYEVTGSDTIDTEVVGIRVHREGTLTGDRYVLLDRSTKIPAEIAPADLSQARAAASRFAAGDPILRTGENPVRYWMLEPGELRARIDRLRPVYDTIIALAPDEGWRWNMRARLLDTGDDRKRGAADYDKAIALEPSAENYADRSSFRSNLGDIAGALADQQAAFDLEGSVANGLELARFMSRAKRYDEAIDLLEGLDASGDERMDVVRTRAQILGEAGRPDEGWELLEQAEKERPGDPATVDSQCWYMGTMNYRLDDALAVCDRAVAANNYSSGVLDSRGLVHYRLGDLAKAKADYDAALVASPGTSSSLFMRAVVEAAQGDATASKRDLAWARRLYGDIDAFYARYGIAPGK